MALLPSLAGLGRMAQGWNDTDEQLQRYRANEQAMKINALKLQEYQRQQQDQQQGSQAILGALGQYFGNSGPQQSQPDALPSAVQRDPLPALPGGNATPGMPQPGPAPGIPSGTAMPPLSIPSRDPALRGKGPLLDPARQMQAAPGGGYTGRGSWFGNQPGWKDPMSGSQTASGRPLSEPGIALPSRQTLGQQFDVTGPNGQTMRLPQTDVGPAAWTGRGIDINSAAAQRMGYSPQNFPTDAQFQWKQVGAEIDQGTPPQDKAQGQQISQGMQQALGPAAQQGMGQVDLGKLVQAIEKGAPGASPSAKVYALKELSGLLNAQSKNAFQQAWEMYKFNTTEGRHEREFAQREADRSEERGFRRESLDIQRQNAQGSNKGFQIYEKEGKTYRVNPNTGEVAEMPGMGGMSKVGSRPHGEEFTDADATYWATILKSGGTLPANFARSDPGGRRVTQIMKKMAATGSPEDFIVNHSQAKANTSSLTQMTKIADASTGFERVFLANLDNAMRLMKDVSPTNLGPFFNRYIMEGEKMFGDPGVPAGVAALVTAANEYARIMNGSTSAAGSTVDSRREAYELFLPFLSYPQLEAVANVAKQDVANKRRETYSQIDAIKERMRNPNQPAGGTAPQHPASGGGQQYSVGQEISKGGKRYRVTGGDPNDPDVEEIK